MGPSALIAPCSGRAGASAAGCHRQALAVDLRRQEQWRAALQRLAEHLKRTELRQLLRKAAGRFARRRPIGDTVAQPHDLRPVQRLLPQLFEGRHAVDRPRLGLPARGGAHRLGGAEATHGRSGRIGRGADQDDLAAVALGAGGEPLQRAQALVPAGRCGPAVVDHQDERPLAAQLRFGIEHRPGEGKDHQRGEQQPQQQKPRRGARRCLLFGLQA